MKIVNKNFTQGGQVVFYMFRLFLQVNKIIFHWGLVSFACLTGLIFLWVNADRINALKMGYYYYISKLSHSINSNATIKISLKDFNASVPTKDVIGNVEFKKASDYIINQLITSSLISFVVTVTGLLLFLTYINRVGKKQSVDEYVSGRKFEENPKKVAKEMKKKGIDSDIILGDIPIVRDSEVQHILFHGTTGTGKSSLLLQLISQLKERGFKKGDKVIIYDKGYSLLTKLYRAGIDYILNPLDSRCENWDLWNECKTRADFERFAETLIPKNSKDPFWNDSARILFYNIAYEMRDQNPTYKDFLRNLLTVDASRLKTLLKGTESENLLDANIIKTLATIRGVITTHVRSLSYLQGLNENNKKIFNIKNWLLNENDHGFLYITSDEEYKDTVRPLITTWLSTAISAIFSLGEDRIRRVWFLIDELPSLDRIDFLDSALAEGRKFGACFFIGIQNMAQLEDIYDIKKAQSILDLINTRYFFRSPNSELAKRVSTQLGSAVYLVMNDQYSYGLDEVRDGNSFNKKEQNKPVATADQVMMLSDLSCYVTFPTDLPATKLTFKYVSYPKIADGIIKRRLDLSLKDDSSLATIKNNLMKKENSNNNGDDRELKQSNIFMSEKVGDQNQSNIDRSTSIRDESIRENNTFNDEEMNINNPSKLKGDLEI